MSQNRFDLLRLVFAATVFFYHAIALGALASASGLELSLAPLAELAIEGFFVISGALVYGSYERSSSLGVYSEKRFRRLYPAYAVVVILPALISLVLLLRLGATERLGEIAAYLGANLVFLNFLAPTLPELFEGQRFEAVNGALWTLKIEVMFYIGLPLLALLMRALGRFRWVLLLAIYLAAEAYRLLLPFWFDHPLAPMLARQLPGQMSYFAAGIALWILRAPVSANPGKAAALGAVLFAASFLSPFLEPLRAAGLAGLIAGAAFAPGPRLHAARWGDFSYGVYITHFPILQMLVALGVFTSAGLAGGFAVAALLVILASVLLWHIVERPALRADSHYRQAEGDDATFPNHRR